MYIQSPFTLFSCSKEFESWVDHSSFILTLLVGHSWYILVHAHIVHLCYSWYSYWGFGGWIERARYEGGWTTKTNLKFWRRHIKGQLKLPISCALNDIILIYDRAKFYDFIGWFVCETIAYVVWSWYLVWNVGIWLGRSKSDNTRYCLFLHGYLPGRVCYVEIPIVHACSSCSLLFTMYTKNSSML